MSERWMLTAEGYAQYGRSKLGYRIASAMGSGSNVCGFFDAGDGAGYFEDAVVGGSLAVAESWRVRASARRRWRARRKCG